MIILRLSVVAAAVTLAASSMAAGFVNGDFETGNLTGWTIGGGNRNSPGSLFNPMDPARFLPGGDHYNATIANSHSAIINTSYVDPHLGAKLGSTVYGGTYALRVEDTVSGGYASVAKQTVASYTDPDIFFAWKAVLLGAHSVNDAATMQIQVKDETSGTVLINRTYNAASGGGGVDPRFTYDGSTNNYYTAAWQIEQLTLAGVSGWTSGDSVSISVLASDCQPTAHWGYVYLDGFGNVNPAPEPASLALVGVALAGLGVARRRRTAR